MIWIAQLSNNQVKNRVYRIARKFAQICYINILDSYNKF